MKLKSLLFGSAAVIAVGTGAQAADLPTVEPVEYVRICDAFGVGFYYIPGTDTCLRIAGYVRVELHYVDGNHVDRFGGTATEDAFNNWTTRARGHLSLDARTQTDFGLVRAYFAMDETVGATNAGNYPDSFGVSSAFIQISNDWGTYTAGHTGSNFDFFSGYGYGTRLSLDDNTGEATQFAWTFAGGNGFSLTIAAEDPLSDGRRINGTGVYQGQEFPDGVANIRVDQGWGSAQLMGAVHTINTTASTKVGFAAGAGFELKIPGGWSIGTQGGYSEGAIGYLSGDPGGVGDIDAAFNLNKSWNVFAGIKGPLINPNLTAWVDGGFIHAVDSGATHYDFWAVRAGAKYSPVAGLGFGPEFAYQNLNSSAPASDYQVWGLMWRLQRDF